MNAQNNPFGNAAFSPGSPFPFPPAAAPTSDTSRISTPVTAQAATVDVPATKVEDPPSIPVKENIEPRRNQRNLLLLMFPQKKHSRKLPLRAIKNRSRWIHQMIPNQFLKMAWEASQELVLQNVPPPLRCITEKLIYDGCFCNEFDSAYWYSKPSIVSGSFGENDGRSNSTKDGYLPEEMRNPATFKWMLQNPQYRQQLQDMLNLSSSNDILRNNMGGSPEWDSRMMDSLKSFDLSSPEVKQQFDAFRGIFEGNRPGKEYVLPRIHVYGFSKAQDPEFDFHERIRIALSEAALDVEMHRVRAVAPGKWMLCASFILPESVAYSKTGSNL
ncbi:UNVERIFIED_CONTAM: tRNA (guanine(37)-N1)-methyltransferase 1 [Sesamum angustifolium]|uniref:tRNA (Guanine(37)-N1)-methyltransferase 1 n=1 Tax=Sesamum angustifolium TaxID=2727405 RepID=A0AAW2L5D2_9LAMI